MIISSFRWYVISPEGRNYHALALSPWKHNKMWPCVMRASPSKPPTPQTLLCSFNYRHRPSLQHGADTTDQNKHVNTSIQCIFAYTQAQTHMHVQKRTLTHQHIHHQNKTDATLTWLPIFLLEGLDSAFCCALKQKSQHEPSYSPPPHCTPSTPTQPPFTQSPASLAPHLPSLNVSTLLFPWVKSRNTLTAPWTGPETFSQRSSAPNTPTLEPPAATHLQHSYPLCFKISAEILSLSVKSHPPLHRCFCSMCSRACSLCMPSFCPCPTDIKPDDTLAVGGGGGGGGTRKHWSHALTWRSRWSPHGWCSCRPAESQSATWSGPWPSAPALVSVSWRSALSPPAAGGSDSSATCSKHGLKLVVSVTMSLALCGPWMCLCGSGMALVWISNSCVDQGWL